MTTSATQMPTSATEKTSVRFTAEECRDLAALAQRVGTSRSRLLRVAIRLMVDVDPEELRALDAAMPGQPGRGGRPSRTPRSSEARA